MGRCHERRKARSLGMGGKRRAKTKKDGKGLRMALTTRPSRLVTWHLVLCALPLAVLWFVLIHQLRLEWSVNPQYAYGWAVPCLCAYLLWKRVQRPQVSNRAVDCGSGAQDRRVSTKSPKGLPAPSILHPILFLLLVLAYLPIRLVQEASPDWRLPTWLLSFTVIGLTLLMLGFALRNSNLEFRTADLTFPICFFLVSVPWPKGPHRAARARFDALERLTDNRNPGLVWPSGDAARQCHRNRHRSGRD